MQNKCKKCGKLNEDESKFCDDCGASFSGDSQLTENINENNESDNITPAEQAAVMINKTKEKTKQTTKVAKKIWKKLLFSEQIIVFGALLGIVSFFLPWITVVLDMEKTLGSGFEIAKEWRFLFLYPIAMLTSLALIYFSQGASVILKIKLARWQILLGTFWLTMGVACLIVISSMTEAVNDFMEGFLGSFGSYNNYYNDFFTVSYSVGMWMFLLSALLIIVGAFKLQSTLLDKNKE